MMSERLATTLRLCSTIRMVYFAEMRLISAAILSMSSCPMPAIGSSSSIIFRSSASVGAITGAAVETIEHGLGPPEIEGVPVLALQRHPDIFERGEVRKHRRNLERAHQAKTRHIGRRQRGNI